MAQLLTVLYDFKASCLFTYTYTPILYHVKECFMAQVLVALDDGQRILPSYVNRHTFDYGSPEKGTLHSWDSGALATERCVWQRLEHVFEGYVARSRAFLQQACPHVLWVCSVDWFSCAHQYHQSHDSFVSRHIQEACATLKRGGSSSGL